MEHPRAKYHRHHEEDGDSRVEDVIYDSKHLGLAEGAYEGEGISDEIELGHLGFD